MHRLFTIQSMFSLCLMTFCLCVDGIKHTYAESASVGSRGDKPFSSYLKQMRHTPRMVLHAGACIGYTLSIHVVWNLLLQATFTE